jgi:hypothetical protein
VAGQRNHRDKHAVAPAETFSMLGGPNESSDYGNAAFSHRAGQLIAHAVKTGERPPRRRPRPRRKDG